jgi:hypothetical protein
VRRKLAIIFLCTQFVCCPLLQGKFLPAMPSFGLYYFSIVYTGGERTECVYHVLETMTEKVDEVCTSEDCTLVACGPRASPTANFRSSRASSCFIIQFGLQRRLSPNKSISPLLITGSWVWGLAPQPFHSSHGRVLFSPVWASTSGCSEHPGTSQ